MTSCEVPWCSWLLPFRGRFDCFWRCGLRRIGADDRLQLRERGEVISELRRGCGLRVAQHPLHGQHFDERRGVRLVIDPQRFSRLTREWQELVSRKLILTAGR